MIINIKKFSKLEKFPCPLRRTFYVLAKYDPFWLWTGSKMKILIFFIKYKSFVFIKESFCILWKTSKFSFFGHVQSQNEPYFAKMENGRHKFFWIFNSKWQTTRKLIKSSKNVGGKLTHFCLGAKTWIGRWDPYFTLKSKIFVFCSSFL